MLFNAVTKKVQFMDTKEALVGIDDNAMGNETFKNNSQVLEVLFWSGTGDENIVNLGVGSRDTSENLMYESLESLCCNLEAEGHSHELEEAEWCCDSGLRYVFGGNWNLVVRTDEVQFGENGGILH